MLRKRDDGRENQSPSVLQRCTLVPFPYYIDVHPLAVVSLVFTIVDYTIVTVFCVHGWLYASGCRMIGSLFGVADLQPYSPKPRTGTMWRNATPRTSLSARDFDATGAKPSLERFGGSD